MSSPLTLINRSTHEVEKFESFNEFYSYCTDCLDRNIYQVFKEALDTGEQHDMDHDYIFWWEAQTISSTKDIMDEMGYTLLIEEEV